ncbi:leucine-rich_repeat domain-containing protein [Hexamita inflata]|uniref:Leucine-rich repeat domain-containing protein n=1 Tax=Hexamita inflata TaxID=28002 RepID=A0AA86Q2W8_9EUKA|nr:leucine-rich repeat domain-containing protein [Hexamita inflata]
MSDSSENEEYQNSSDQDEYQSDYNEQSYDDDYIPWEYEPQYTVKDTGRVYVYEESALTTFVFADNVNKQDCGSQDPYIYIEKCPNVSFKRVPYSIRKLKICNCGLKNIKGLSQMNLWELNLSWNKITDISELAKFRCDLDDLNLSYNRIVDISPLGLDPETKQLTLMLSYLNLIGNRIVNIDALEDQTSFRELYLSDNCIYDLTPIKNIIKKEKCELKDSFGQIINGVFHPVRNYAYEYPNKNYVDGQYRLNVYQQNYQDKYSAYMNSKKKSILVSRRLQKIHKTNYKAPAQTALETIQHNFSNLMNQVVVLLKSTESFSDQ